MRHERGTRHLMMDNYSFERVTNFECLRVNINESTDNNEDIWLRFIAKTDAISGYTVVSKSKILSHGGQE